MNIDVYGGGPPYKTALTILNTTGNVGIGTTAPTALTHILQTGAGDAFRVDDVLADTSPFVIKADGNVGIGTTAPLAALQVNGVLRAATANDLGTISLGEYAGTTINVGLWRGGTNVLTGGNVLNLGGYGGIQFSVGAAVIGSQTNAMFIKDDGNVGIGTTDPGAYKLNVNGTINATAVLVNGSAVGGVSYPLTAIQGFAGYESYTNFSGGISTGGSDSITSALRITHDGNLVNIGSIQAGEMNLTKGGTFAAKVDYTTSGYPKSVAIGDFNGDGKADLAVANASSNSVSVLLNNGDGTFAAKVDYTTGTSPRSVAIGDLNGDGKADLAVANSSNSVSVFFNNGDGTFAAKVDYTAGSSPYAVAMSDLNGDGKNDLAVTNEYSNNFSIFINNGDGTFAAKVDYSVGSNAYGIAIGDLDGDNKVDLAIARTGWNMVTTFLNNGDGTFVSGSDFLNTNGVNSVVLGDLNGDGKTDLATANGNSNSVSVFLNNGDGTFAAKVDYTTGTNPFFVTSGDLNGDGKADLAVVNNYDFGKLSVFLNNATSMFYAQASTGNVGIGTTSPAYALDVAAGYVNSVSGYKTNYADYAEYFYTVDTDLEPGEAVCVDIIRENAVKRCAQASDGNLMGIVSTNPAIVGNNEYGRENNDNYVVIGMLGQVPAKVSTENGAIRPGDSLTSASGTPGYMMRANAGDPTVGVALEGLISDGEVVTGTIKVLISRRNKSITVEEVEEKVTDRIAAMEIEDEVNILIANAVNSLNLEDEINSAVDPKLLLLATRLTVASDDLSGKIINNETNIANVAGNLAELAGSFANAQNDILNLKSQILKYEKSITINEAGAISMANLSSGSAATAINIDANNEIFRVTSSRRYKQDIADLEINSNLIYNLRPVSFTWTDDTISAGQRDFGLIAEETAEVLPQLVNYNAQGQPESVKYSMLSIFLLNETQKIAREINQLKLTVGLAGDSLQVENGLDFNPMQNYTLDEAGYLVINKIKADEIKAKVIIVDDTDSDGINLIGNSAIEANTDKVTIMNEKVATSSKIFVTWQNNIDSSGWWICDKISGKSFSVCLDQPVAASASFDYWIILVEENQPVEAVSAEAVLAAPSEELSDLPAGEPAVEVAPEEEASTSDALPESESEAPVGEPAVEVAPEEEASTSDALPESESEAPVGEPTVEIIEPIE
ncbi:MAG: FG-GAP-like repeat-containing protein [Candidatus Paceibacterota bacterium]